MVNRLPLDDSGRDENTAYSVFSLITLTVISASLVKDIRIRLSAIFQHAGEIPYFPLSYFYIAHNPG